MRLVIVENPTRKCYNKEMPTRTNKKIRRWSSQEITLLRKLYPNLLVRNLVKFFPRRNKATIVAKALSLKLPSAKLWQSEENNILHKYFAEASLGELRKLLPKRSGLAILAQGERLGLERNRNKPRRNINEDYFKKWSPNMAYILGFILTDGCIIEGTYKGYSDALKFGVRKSDIDILEKIKREFHSEHTISFVENAAHLTITSQKMVDDLKGLGILYRKSLREGVPKIPQKYVRDFIRGVVDGNGSISIDKAEYPNLSFCGGKKIVTFVRDYFLSKFNIYSKVDKRKRPKMGKQYLFYIGYRCNSAKTLINYLYNDANLYLDRKFKLAKRCLKIEMKYRKNYTEEENQAIRQFYRPLPKDKVLLMLSNRSWSSIQQQARVLGIYKYNIKK